MESMDHFPKCRKNIYGVAGISSGSRERLYSTKCAHFSNPSADKEVPKVRRSYALVKVLR
uniref:Uncharacterized protein n=1 Tax=Rhizophora mucronata TaxID=61149 RepID=A0A2P2NXU5_RHIMU